ncbi:MAG TPA: ATP-grasp domain-containing protein [Chromatiaceae bacterium]|nr:ATP-grasp domain-containing protein [Chromatiaceae bacterium]
MLELAGGYVKYWGGVSPLRDGEIVRRVGDVLARVASCYPELRGYVGFDVVMSGSRVYVVEVNPRLTTSFVGIAELFPKVAEFMVKALESPEELPGPVYVGNVTSGAAYYAIGCREAQSAGEKALGGVPSGRALLVGVMGSVEAARRRVLEIVKRCYGSEPSDTLSTPA